MRRWCTRRRLAVVAGVLLAAWLASGFVVVYALTRRSGPFDEPVPAELAAHTEAFRIRTRDGLALGAWWVPADRPERAALVLHGNGASRTVQAGLVRMLRDRGTSVLALTLRAHGDSEGDVNDLGWSARADVVAGLEALERRAPDLPIVLVGTSLGAVAALYAVDEAAPRVDAWILAAPYRDLESAVRARLALFLPPVLDGIAWSTMRLSAPLLLDPPVDALRPIEFAGRLPAGVPVLVLTGDRDRQTPLDGTRELCARARGELVVFPGADHVELAYSDPELFVVAFERACAGIRRVERNGGAPPRQEESR